MLHSSISYYIWLTIECTSFMIPSQRSITIVERAKPLNNQFSLCHQVLASPSPTRGTASMPPALRIEWLKGYASGMQGKTMLKIFNCDLERN